MNNMWYKLNKSYENIELFVHDIPYTSKVYYYIDNLYKGKYVSVIKHTEKSMRRRKFLHERNK